MLREEQGGGAGACLQRCQTLRCLFFKDNHRLGIIDILGDQFTAMAWANSLDFIGFETHTFQIQIGKVEARAMPQDTWANAL